MRETPRQPKDLDADSESLLSTIGFLIEAWDAAKSSSQPVAERVSSLIKNVTKLIYASRQLNEAHKQEIGEDVKNLVAFNGTEDEFVQFCDERSGYWKDFREEFIKPV